MNRIQLPRHPVDAYIRLAQRMGYPMPLPEVEAAMRQICDEVVTESLGLSDYQCHLAVSALNAKEAGFCHIASTFIDLLRQDLKSNPTYYVKPSHPIR